MRSTLEQEAFFEQVIFQSLGSSEPIDSYEMISGGSVNLCVKINCKRHSYFLKFNSQAPDGLFEAEWQNLEELRTQGKVNTPEPIAYGKVDTYDYLLLNYVSSGNRNSCFWQQLGQSLAHLHYKKAEMHGFHHDNYIGTLRQANTLYSKNWSEFFITQRLNVQAGLAYYNHIISREELKIIQGIYPRLEQVIPKEAPSLLHGDLWAENFICNSENKPIFIDPATYYGHREMDIAMTYLFGGFEKPFYEAYNEIYPLQKGFNQRIALHNMYPLLVHVNLFGRSYLKPVLKTALKYS